MASGEGKMVCVTGASGYIASWLVKNLLDRGYTVKATVRNLNDEKKTKHLLALDGAKQRLHLFEADLLKESSFDSAIDGCVGVFHSASPCYLDCKDPQAELIEPAVKGTINVLTSCAKSSSIKRVIFTSTAGTMIVTPWKLVKEKGVDMVVINPGFTVGPLLQPTLNFSSAVIASLVNNGIHISLNLFLLIRINYVRHGANAYPNARSLWVHIKDVVLAHILAFEDPSASGRYAVIERHAHFSEILSIIRELYPALPLPDKCVDGAFQDAVQISNEKAKSLGIDSYIPLKVGLKETIESLREKKLITF
ncbi:hypothetical protein V2J09_000955 [Rumex salicifolius]